MSENEIFDIPEKPKKKRVMTEEQKQVLRDRLKLAREAKKANREKRKTAKAKAPEPEPEKVESKVENDSPSVSTDEDKTVIDLSEPKLDLDDIDDQEKDILNLQLDIEELNNKIKTKKKKNNYARGVVINRRRKEQQEKDIENEVNRRLNERLASKEKVNTPQDQPKKDKKDEVKISSMKKENQVKSSYTPPVQTRPAPVGMKKPFWAL